MKEVQLTQGFVARIDDEDWDLVTQYKWHVVRKPRNAYAMAHPVVNGKRLTVLMHRLILSAPKDLQVDHMDHDGLNNQRENLRLVTNAQNQMNCNRRPKNSTGYKGVGRLKNGRYRATAYRLGTCHFFGNFDTPVEAALAYDAGAKKLFGPYARTNFPAKE